MTTVEISIPSVMVDRALLIAVARQLADNVTSGLVYHTKIQLSAADKVASGTTMRSIRGRVLSDGGVSGVWHRQVVGARSGLHYIISGRRTAAQGAKWPVRLVGTGPRGGKIFEPLPAILRWMQARGIPKTQWFPVVRAIATRGIPPVNIPQRAVRAGRSLIAMHCRVAAMKLANGIIKVNAR